MSASAPAGKAKRTTGRLPAVSTSATSTGEMVNAVINHDSPTSCIHVPIFEAIVAIQSVRKRDSRRGFQAETGRAKSFSGRGSFATVVLLVGFATISNRSAQKASV